jgi:hypothetical protein
VAANLSLVVSSLYSSKSYSIAMVAHNSFIISTIIINSLGLSKLLLPKHLLNLSLFVYSCPSTFLLILISIGPEFLDPLVSLYKDFLILETPVVSKNILLNF